LRFARLVVDGVKVRRVRANELEWLPVATRCAAYSGGQRRLRGCGMVASGDGYVVGLLCNPLRQAAGLQLSPSFQVSKQHEERHDRLVAGGR